MRRSPNDTEAPTGRRTLGIMIAAAAIACFTAAAAADSPRQIVDALYAPYLHAPPSDSVQTPDPLDSIATFASDSLGKAIQKNRACEEREEGICAIDFDILICGQDWDITHFRSTLSGDKTAKPIVRATFDNMGQPASVSFLFIRESGTWRIDDVIATCPDGDSARPAPAFPLKKALLAD